MSNLLSLTMLAVLSLQQASAQALPYRGVEICAHRGVRAYAPENTLTAFRASIRIGLDWIDMDVVLTKDHEVLLSHDPVLNPDITRDERGRFLAPSREALKKRSPAERAEYERK